MSASAKREYILTTAVSVFGRYGYKRASMDLLAQAAGMSRPALYQQFSSKQDVFRAMCALMFQNMLDAGEEALRAKGAAGDRLYNLLSIKLDMVVGAIEIEFRSELLAEVGLYANDVLAAFQEQFVGLIVRFLESSTDELNLVNVVITAHDCANLLMDGVVGVSHEDAEPKIQRRRLRQLADLTVRSLGGITPTIQPEN